jgi:hypothetical protein
LGYLGEVVEFTRTVIEGKQTPEAKVDRGGGDAVTAHHFANPGDDSQPLPTDVAYVGDDQGTGNGQVLGYQDPETAPVAGAGEKRIYARSGAGAVACAVWLKADGAIVVDNPQGSVELKADGSLLLSNPQGSVELASDGSISAGNALGSIKVDAAGSVSWTTPLGTNVAATHMHGSPFGPTTAPIPGT